MAPDHNPQMRTMKPFASFLLAAALAARVFLVSPQYSSTEMTPKCKSAK